LLKAKEFGFREYKLPGNLSRRPDKKRQVREQETG